MPEVPEVPEAAAPPPQVAREGMEILLRHGVAMRAMASGDWDFLVSLCDDDVRCFHASAQREATVRDGYREGTKTTIVGHVHEQLPFMQHCGYLRGKMDRCARHRSPATTAALQPHAPRLQLCAPQAASLSRAQSAVSRIQAAALCPQAQVTAPHAPRLQLCAPRLQPRVCRYVNAYLNHDSRAEFGPSLAMGRWGDRMKPVVATLEAQILGIGDADSATDVRTFDVRALSRGDEAAAPAAIAVARQASAAAAAAQSAAAAAPDAARSAAAAAVAAAAALACDAEEVDVHVLTGEAVV